MTYIIIEYFTMILLRQKYVQQCLGTAEILLSCFFPVLSIIDWNTVEFISAEPVENTLGA